MLKELPAGCVLIDITATDDRKVVHLLRDILGTEYLYVVEVGDGGTLQAEITKKMAKRKTCDYCGEEYQGHICPCHKERDRNENE